ncbi:c-type cytochrome [Desulfuromonas versatilis]|uniref:C-type cytochrome n=1 Tax=Desulfuromonas versatilis TaxID=2802975 RepID=A0ABM8HQ99_9BACT|nr:cytochrome c3 family protein [Desulfuromonas versatilis]BCR03933.1 c-type cytochrome [Desulfuromonas versatilis]
MRKYLLLVAAALLLAAPAMGLTIQGSAHDLSNTTGGGAAGDIDELCVYCHSPHGVTASVSAPLWNRGMSNATQIYSGVDIQATYDLTSYNATDAPLCLSCHDGASIGGALTNPPNSGGALYSPALGADADLGTNLSNDHPIGFDYAAIDAGSGAGEDSEIKLITDATAAGVQFFGASSNIMWCSSCHDVHDPANVPFLLVDNTSSNLCLACHDK